MFTAVANQGRFIGPNPEETTVVFNEEITNVGGGYDNSTGKLITLMITFVNYILGTVKQAVQLFVAPW